MAIINVTLPSDGTTASVANYNVPINTILAGINGNLDDNNIASLSGTKITANTIPITALSATTKQGWITGQLAVPNTITALGNRLYQLVFNGVDYTSILSVGMRMRSTRTIAAATQTASLNGTTQNFSRASASLTAMTFTSSFSISSWIKLAAYPSGGGNIISRYNGVSGWQLYVEPSGQITSVGRNGGAGNYRGFTSLSSIPINKWVHIAGQVDMVTNTATPTTNYCMIDGLDVNVNAVTAGTNPTALIQAGNLEVGSANGGAAPLAAKLSQTAIYSTKVVQATMLATIHQGLLGTEPNLISGYTLSGASGFNDLNTTSANNLTANGSVTTTTADSPFGGQTSGLISSTLDYSTVVDTTFSTNTTVTVRATEGNTIPVSGGLSALAYSSSAFPYGFPGGTNVLGESFLQTTFATVGSTVEDVPALKTTIVVSAGKRVEIEVFLPQIQCSVDSIRVDPKIDEDGATIATTYNRTWSNANGGNGGYIVKARKTLTAGTHTYKLRLVSASGINTIYADSISPAYIKVTQDQ